MIINVDKSTILLELFILITMLDTYHRSNYYNGFSFYSL